VKRQCLARGWRNQLEIGFGSGLNLPYYNATVDEIIGIDSSPEMLALAERAVATSHHKNGVVGSLGRRPAVG